MSDLKELGRRMRQARERRGLFASDVAAAVGVATSTVTRYENGQIVRAKLPVVESIAAALGVSPGWLLQLTDDDAPAVPYGFEPLPSFRRVPIVGAIACGLPILADENIQGQADMPEHVHADFALRCKGDSMIDARIHDGDLVFVRKQPEVENGEIAVVRIDDEVTLKYFTRQGSMVILQPANPAYAPMAFSGPDLQRVHVEGKAVAFTSLL